MKKYFYLCLGISVVGAIILAYGLVFDLSSDLPTAKVIFIGVGALLLLGPFIWFGTRPIEKEKKEPRKIK